MPPSISRSRNNPNPKAAEADRRAVIALRGATKIGRSIFAPMVGMTVGSLEAKEAGRLNFKPAEVGRIKRAVESHLADCFRVLGELSPEKTQPK